MKNLALTTSVVMIIFISSAMGQNKEINTAFAHSYQNESAKKYAAAIDNFTKVYNTESYEMNLRLGWLHYLSGNNPQSLNYYQRSAKLMPAATEPLWAIINVYTIMKDWTKIEKVYKKIIKLDPKNSLAHYKLGLIYYYRKEYFKAKKHFDVSLNQAPFNYDYMLMSAWTHYFLGNTNSASLLFQKVLLYNPNDASALEGLALIK